MAVTQYIGARYVPKIYDNPDDNTNNWKQGVEYEPLTMVSYAGGSYTSKVPVPASAANPADAPQYWAYMGSSSGQITTNTNNILKIQHALAAASEAGYIATSARAAGDYVWINGTLYEVTAPVAINDAYVEGINITGVTDAIKELTGAMADLRTDLLTDMTELTNDLKNPYTLCIGDSYAEGWTPDGSNAGWPSYLFNLGVHGEALAVGGAGFHYADTDSRSFLNIITHATLTRPDAEIKRIILCAGYNDMADRSDLRAHVRSFIDYCASRFVNAKIYIGFCGYAWSSNENNITSYDMYAATRDYEIACRWKKAVFMPQVLGCLLGVSSSMASDYKHPNENGNRTIAEAIYAALNGLDYCSSSDYSISLADATNGTSGTLQLAVIVRNGTVTARARAQGFTVEKSTAFNLYNINFTPTHFPLLPYNFSLKAGETIRNYNTSGNLTKNYYTVPCYLFLNSPTVQAVINLMNDAGNNYGATTKVEINDGTQYTTTGSF